ncbi:hypothetical protein J4423_02800 [Candidatus Pacearchaeota archaeon]|nr:hypothetical protein [Candidatus Pacearchaeota archaeon]
MKFDISKIEFSRYDKRREIVLPLNLTPELAELSGIMLGDGNIYMKNNRYEIMIAGDANEDFEYHNNHIAELFKKVFNIKPITKYKFSPDGKKSIATKIESKAMCQFYTQILSLPNGKKKDIQIPKGIDESEEYICKFLRGVADTDFTIRFKNRDKRKSYYPLIEGQFGDRLLVENLKLLLDRIRIHSTLNHGTSYNKKTKKIYQNHRITITGNKNLEKWMNQIGFANNRHLIRYKVWKKLGFCPPHTNMEKGKLILLN